MKINTFVKYKFVANIAVPRQLSDANGTVVLEPAGTMKMKIVSMAQQVIMYTAEPVEFAASITNCLNPKGDKIFVVKNGDVLNEYPMYVNVTSPVVDVYGSVVGYRSILKRTQPLLDSVLPAQD